MNPTKTLVAAVMVLVCFRPYQARADLTMTILTETYHVTGFVQRYPYDSAFGGPPWYPGDYRSYDLTTSSPPVSGAVSILREPWSERSIGVWSSATRYQDASTASFRVEADGSPLEDTTVHPLGGAYDYENPPFVRDAVSADLQVQFRLSGPDDRLHLAVDAQSAGGTGSLTMGGRSWVLYDGPIYRDGFWDSADTLPVDPTQIYTLTMNVWPWYSRGGDGFRTVEFLNISDVSVVPLPGAVLLALLGLGCAGWRLRRGAA